MTKNDVTTGSDLNQYTGNAALANGNAGEASGYATPDFTPLAALALRKYSTNQIDYQQKIKDRDKLQEMYMDPAAYAAVDREYADQLNPTLARFKELSKMHLQDNPESDEWYEFQDTYKKLREDNAKLKTVQTLKEQYQKSAGESADEHEREKMNQYVDKLKTFKLGDEIPVYNKFFKLDVAHLPVGENQKLNYKRLNGNMIESVESNINNPLNLDKKAYQDRVLNPQVYNTGEDIGHTLMLHGGVEELNQKAAEYAGQGRKLNIGLLQEKYKNEFAEFKKTNPAGTFQDFLTASGKSQELKNIDEGLQYLKGQENKGAVQYIPVQPGEPRLQNFTYSEDGKTRLSVDNDILRALYGATKDPIGKTEKVTGSELTDKVAEIALKEAQARVANANVGLIGQKGRTEQAKQRAYDAKASNINKQTSILNPLPTTDVPLIGREAKLITITESGSKSGQVFGSKDQIIVKAGSIPEDLRKKANFAISNAIPKPKAGADASKIKEYEAAIAKAKDDASKASYQMRFFKPDGTDDTERVIKAVKTGKGSIEQFSRDAPKANYTIKFVDNKGNIVATTESIDLQTQMQNNKVNAKGDAALGTSLGADESDDTE